MRRTLLLLEMRCGRMLRTILTLIRKESQGAKHQGQKATLWSVDGRCTILGGANVQSRFFVVGGGST